MPIRKLYLEPTDRCNLNCGICYRRSWEDAECDMGEEMYADLLRQIRVLPSLGSVVIGGIGEPTCAPLFLRMLEDLTPWRPTVTTNGTFTDPAVPEALARYAGTVVLSVDGLSANFERIRGTPLATVEANLRMLAALRRRMPGGGPKIMVQCVLSADNVDDAWPLVDHARSLGADGLIYSNLIPQTADNADRILYARTARPEMIELFSQLRLRAFRHGMRILLPQTELKTERFCPFIEDDAIFVGANGNIHPCYRMSHRYVEYVFGRAKHVVPRPFGNLERSPLTEIWESAAYIAYRERVRNGRYPSCPDCDLADGCDCVRDTEADCWCSSPSCADCLWSRRIVICP